MMAGAFSSICRCSSDRLLRACGIVLVVSAAAVAAVAVELAAPTAVTQLEGDTKHVQGIDLQEDATRLWVTSVDVPGRRGLLSEYQLPSGKLVRSVEIQDG